MRRAALALRHVQRAVRFGERRLRIVAAPVRGDADAEGRDVADREPGVEQAPRDLARVAVVRVEPHEELVAAVAGDRVVVAQTARAGARRVARATGRRRGVPRVSFTCLKWSTSISSKRVAGLQTLDERVGVPPAPDAGQRVAQRLLAERFEQPELLEAAAELARQQPHDLIGDGITR